MEQILVVVLPPEQGQLDPPSAEDWRRLEAKFGCQFGDDYKNFVAFMSRYKFPGDVLNVSSGRTNGNDSIALTYDLEMQGTKWNPAMIPFYAIGNGDYFCINQGECPESPVYYFYAERLSFEPYSPSFGDWVRQLPEFLA